MKNQRFHSSCSSNDSANDSSTQSPSFAFESPQSSAPSPNQYGILQKSSTSPKNSRCHNNSADLLSIPNLNYQLLSNYSSQDTNWLFRSNHCSLQVFDSLSLELCANDSNLIRFESHLGPCSKTLIPPRLRNNHAENNNENNEVDPSLMEIPVPSAASPEMLVVYLTSPTILSYNILSDFFLTYRLYINPFDLLEMLFARLAWAIQFHHFHTSHIQKLCTNFHFAQFDPSYPSSSSQSILLSPSSTSKGDTNADPTPITVTEYGRDVAVRTFVALRHWVLNYFADDFKNSYGMQDQFATYLDALYTWEPIHDPTHNDQNTNDHSNVNKTRDPVFLKILDQLKASWNTQREIYWDLKPLQSQEARQLTVCVLDQRNSTPKSSTLPKDESELDKSNKISSNIGRSNASDVSFFQTPNERKGKYINSPTPARASFPLFSPPSTYNSTDVTDQQIKAMAGYLIRGKTSIVPNSNFSSASLKLQSISKTPLTSLPHSMSSPSLNSSPRPVMLKYLPDSSLKNFKPSSLLPHSASLPILTESHQQPPYSSNMSFKPKSKSIEPFKAPACSFSSVFCVSHNDTQKPKNIQKTQANFDKLPTPLKFPKMSKSADALFSSSPIFPNYTRDICQNKNNTKALRQKSATLIKNAVGFWRKEISSSETISARAADSASIRNPAKSVLQGHYKNVSNDESNNSNEEKTKREHKMNENKTRIQIDVLAARELKKFGKQVKDLQEQKLQSHSQSRLLGQTFKKPQLFSNSSETYFPNVNTEFSINKSASSPCLSAVFKSARTDNQNAGLTSCLPFLAEEKMKTGNEKYGDGHDNRTHVKTQNILSPVVRKPHTASSSPIVSNTQTFASTVVGKFSDKNIITSTFNKSSLSSSASTSQSQSFKSSPSLLPPFSPSSLDHQRPVYSTNDSNRNFGHATIGVNNGFSEKAQKSFFKSAIPRKVVPALAPNSTKHETFENGDIYRAHTPSSISSSETIIRHKHCGGNSGINPGFPVPGTSESPNSQDGDSSVVSFEESDSFSEVLKEENERSQKEQQTHDKLSSTHSHVNNLCNNSFSLSCSSSFLYLDSKNEVATKEKNCSNMLKRNNHTKGQTHDFYHNEGDFENYDGTKRAIVVDHDNTSEISGLNNGLELKTRSSVPLSGSPLFQSTSSATNDHTTHSSSNECELLLLEDTGIELSLTAADIGLELTPEQMLVAQNQKSLEPQRTQYEDSFGNMELQKPTSFVDIEDLSVISAGSGSDVSHKSYQICLDSENTGRMGAVETLQKEDEICSEHKRGSLMAYFQNSNGKRMIKKNSPGFSHNKYIMKACENFHFLNPNSNSNQELHKNYVFFPDLSPTNVAELALIPDDVPAGDFMLARETALSKLEGTYDQFKTGNKKSQESNKLAEPSSKYSAGEKTNESHQNVDSQQSESTNEDLSVLVNSNDSVSSTISKTNLGVKPKPLVLSLKSDNLCESSDTKNHTRPVDASFGSFRVINTTLEIPSRKYIYDGTSIQPKDLESNSTPSTASSGGPILSAFSTSYPQSPITSPLKEVPDIYKEHTSLPLVFRRHSESNRPFEFESNTHEKRNIADTVRDSSQESDAEMEKTKAAALAINSPVTSYVVPMSAPPDITTFDIGLTPSNSSKPTLNIHSTIFTKDKTGSLKNSQVFDRLASPDNFPFCGTDTPPEEVSFLRENETDNHKGHNRSSKLGSRNNKYYKTDQVNRQVDFNDSDHNVSFGSANDTSSMCDSSRYGMSISALCCCACCRRANFSPDNSVSTANILTGLSFASSPSNSISQLYNEAFETPRTTMRRKFGIQSSVPVKLSDVQPLSTSDSLGCSAENNGTKPLTQVNNFSSLPRLPLISKTDKNTLPSFCPSSRFHNDLLSSDYNQSTGNNVCNNFPLPVSCSSFKKDSPALGALSKNKQEKSGAGLVGDKQISLSRKISLLLSRAGSLNKGKKAFGIEDSNKAFESFSKNEMLAGAWTGDSREPLSIVQESLLTQRAISNTPDGSYKSNFKDKMDNEVSINRIEATLNPNLDNNVIQNTVSSSFGYNPPKIPLNMSLNRFTSTSKSANISFSLPLKYSKAYNAHFSATEKFSSLSAGAQSNEFVSEQFSNEDGMLFDITGHESIDSFSTGSLVADEYHIPFILTSSSRILAEQLTLIERDAFSQVSWKELVSHPWNKSPDTINSWVSFLSNHPNCQGTELVISRFNLVVDWVKSEILLTRNLKERTATLTSFIHIAHHSRRLQNFSTMMQIVLALSSFAIRRLGKTWACISPNDQFIFSQLEDIVSPSRNFEKLRVEINCIDTRKGCIPFFGIYLSDIAYNAERPVFIELYPHNSNTQVCPSLSSTQNSFSKTATPSLSNSTKLINIDRFRVSSAIVKSFSRCIELSRNYDLKPNHDILAKCLYIHSLTEAEMDSCYKYLDQP